MERYALAGERELLTGGMAMVDQGAQPDAQHATANQEACFATSARYGVTRAQATNCGNRLIGCPDCPFRDPCRDPAVGDRLTLADGKQIEVVALFPRAVNGAQVEYKRIGWSRVSGGRARYSMLVSAWLERAKGAKVLRRGPPVFSTRGIHYRYRGLVERVLKAARQVERAAEKGE